MSKVSFDIHARKAEADGLSHTEIAGRYSLQAAGERRMVGDVAEKLALGAEDTLLEIGCGPGGLLIPLSFMCASATGLDHAAVIDKLQERFSDPSVSAIGANFLEHDFVDTFPRILIYSVVQLLADEAEVMVFIRKAAGLLSPGGRLLVGDIPNEDKKRRFLATDFGKAFEQSFREELRAAGPSKVDKLDLPVDPDMARFDDAVIARIIGGLRGDGFDVYWLAQPVDLPFGRTREDLLVVRPG